MTEETHHPESAEETQDFISTDETSSTRMRKEKLDRIYKIGKLVCLAVIAGALLTIVLRGHPGRYVKYGVGDVILDTQTGELLLYDVQTMELKPHKPKSINY